MRDILRYVLVVVALLPMCAVANEVIEGKVVDVGFDSELTVRQKNGQEVKIWLLYGIVVPEYGHAYNMQARQFIRSNTFHKNIRAKFAGYGEFGRRGYIVTLENGNVLNEKLLRAGMAWIDESSCKWLFECHQWRREARVARERAIGVWKDGHPSNEED